MNYNLNLSFLLSSLSFFGKSIYIYIKINKKFVVFCVFENLKYLSVLEEQSFSPN